MERRRSVSTFLKEARELFLQEKAATLATLLEGHPYASLVTYAATPDQRGALLLLSRLAIHTKNLLQDPRVSLLVVESGRAVEDPQALARVCLMGQTQLISRQDENYQTLAGVFRARISSEHLFGLGDFELFLLSVKELRYVGGFGRITSISGEAWASFG
jgi:putative heme iron utilization protein